jgi:hypothetical protein
MKQKILKSFTAIAGIALSLPTSVVHGHETKKFITNTNNQKSDNKFENDQQRAPLQNDENRRILKSIKDSKRRERLSHDVRRLDTQKLLFLQILESEMQQQQAAANEDTDEVDIGNYFEAEGEQIGDTATDDDVTDDEILNLFNKGSATIAFRKGKTSKKETKAPKSTDAPKAPKASKGPKSTKKPKSSKAPKSVKSDLPSLSPVPTATVSPSPSTSFSPSPSGSFSPSFSLSPSGSFSPLPSITYEPTISSKKSKNGKGGPSMMGKGNQSMMGKGNQSMMGKGEQSMMGKGGTKMGKGSPNMMGKGSDKNSKSTIVASDFPTFTPTPSTSFSPTPTLSPVPSVTILPTQSYQPTVCESSKKGSPTDKNSKTGKGMMVGGKGMTVGGKGMMSGGKGMMSDGKGGMMGKGKGGNSKEGNDCPEPTLSPSPSTSLTSMCPPTSGTCIRSSADLQQELDQANVGDVVALCDRTTIRVNEAIFLTQDDITLCCDGEGCTLLGSGLDSLLVVDGSSVTLQDIRFLDGFGSRFDGGNVAIQADGSHLIVGCDFINGTTNAAGGNLFVETRGRLSVFNSRFVDGVAGTVGGGIAVLDALYVNIADTTFVNNAAANGGAFYDAVDPRITDRSHELALSNSLFNANSAENGGGFFVGQLPTSSDLPVIVITSNDFLSNEATQGGGAGVFLDGLDSIDLRINSNSGALNTAAPQLCPDFLTVATTTSTQANCIAVDETYP